MSEDKPKYWSIIEPLGPSASSCGYCGSKSDTSQSYGVWAHQLSPEVKQVYQRLMDTGWRRSGSYLYLPDRKTTCCPPYTIRCSASAFAPTRSQRQAVNRWKRFVENGAGRSNLSENPTTDKFELSKVFKSSEEVWNTTHQQRRLEIRLEPASFSEEKYELYKKYQTMVHNDTPDKISESSFRRFLCSNPFNSGKPVAHHAQWLIDGNMIAFSVIDILPLGISSVYLVWDPEYAKLSLGRVTALREIDWIREWRGNREFDERFDWYYLGYYIHSCPKMKYKGEYNPSFLLDPSTQRWKTLASCLPILESNPTNVLTFEDPATVKKSKSDDTFPQDSLARILDSLGQITLVPKTDPRVREAADRLGDEILNQVLVCVE